MIRAGVGHSTANNPHNAAGEATAAALRAAGLTRAEAAICFATTAHGAAFHPIMRIVRETAGTDEVVGCSAIGVIAAEHEIESGPAVAVLVIGGGDITARRLFVPSTRGRATETANEIAAAVNRSSGSSKLLCLFADTYNLEPGALLAALNRQLSPEVTVVGGGATEDGTVGETFVFCGDTVSSNAVAGMILSGDFDLNLGASIACVPLGRGHRVTAVRDNVLAGLDGRPAFKVFAETVGPLAEDMRRAMAFVFLAVPHDANAERLERGNYFLRNVIGASPEHGMLAVSHRPQVGDLVGFALRDAERARNDLKLTLDEMSGRSAIPPSFGFYFDCVSRGSGLYQLPGHDSAYIRRHFGPVPVIGFFTGFEIGPAGPLPGMLQYSGVLAMLSERHRMLN
ncbi:MAG: FIST C-terminal domain-containing protein [Candidatus Binataceae bacterium]|nr:FIST C-terminal domain-containing protein [Candidatus Binataceae bacterium]